MKTCRGFTLIELMIAIAVLAILLALGTPSFIDAIRDNRATTATNSLVTALQLARTEAIKRRQNVIVCRRNGNGCQDGTDWSAGWLVQTGGNTIQTWDPPGGDTTVGASHDTVTFDSNGRATAARNFNVSYPDCTGSKVRTVSVAVTGRVSTVRTACP